MAEQVPELARAYSSFLTLNGEAEPFEYRADLNNAGTISRALTISGDVSLNYLNESTCNTRLQKIVTDPYTPDFSGLEDDVAVSLSEATLNENLTALWSQGLLCFTDEEFEPLLESIDDIFDASIGNLGASLEITDRPDMQIIPTGITLTIPEAHLRVTGGSTSEELLDTRINITANVDLTPNTSIAMMSLSINDISLNHLL